MSKLKLPSFLRGSFEVLKMWDSVYDAYVNRYDTDRLVGVNKGIYYDSNFSYSGTDLVTAYYYLDMMPSEIELGYHATLRSCARSGVAINFIEDNELFDIDWSSNLVRSRLGVLENISDSNKKIRSEATVFTEHKYTRERDKDLRTEQSIQYVNIATNSSNTGLISQLYKIRVLVIVTGYRGLAFTETLKDLENLCNKQLDFTLRRVTGRITEYISDLSPFTTLVDKRRLKRYPYTFSSDELRARWHSFEQGVVGFGETYIGTNIYTDSPIFKKFKRDETDAEIACIFGMSGSGKSFLVKVLVTQLVSDPTKILTINDYEGGEYANLARLVGADELAVELDLGSGSGRYIDPVPLVATGLEDVDNQLFTSARSNIISIFRAVAGKDDLVKYGWLKTIIERGVDEFYTRLGVSIDSSTWYRLSGKTIYDIYEVMKEYKPATYSAEFEEQSLYFVESFDPYFNKEKKVNNYFTHPISLDDLLKAKLVIANYGMRGISEDSLSELDAVLIPLNTAMISFYRTVYPSSKGMFNVKVWEELQRYENLGKHAVTVLRTAITGGRKMGDINLVCSNDPSSLVDGSDKFSLFSNYTMALVGKIKSPTIRANLCRELGISSLEGELEQIASVVERNDGLDSGYDEVFEMPYRKAFALVLDSGETAVVKAHIPKWLSEDALFKTTVKRVDSEGY